jgi:hypothetical protein
VLKLLWREIRKVSLLGILLVIQLVLFPALALAVAGGLDLPLSEAISVGSFSFPSF